MLLLRLTIGLLLAFPFAAAAAQSSDCPFVLSGPWTGEHDPEITTSIGVFAGDSAPGTGILEYVGRCGEGFTFRADGEEYTFLPRDLGGQQYASVPKRYSGEGLTVTISIRLDVESPTRMRGRLDVTSGGGMAFGTRAFTMTYAGETEDRPLACECDDLDSFESFFDDQIAEQAFFRDIYAEPRYWERPPGFPERRKWDAYAYELLINGLIEGLSKGLSEEAAYRWAAGKLAERARGSGYEKSNDAASESEEAPTGASIDTGTCEITVYELDAKNCFPYLDREVKLFHERIHQGRCCSMGDARSAALTASAGGEGGEIPARYRTAVNTPEGAGREEVRAYQATIDHLRDWRSWLPQWKGQNCPKAQPIDELLSCPN